MAPLPGLRMRGQCPVLSKLPAVRGCMVSRDHLGRGAFVHKVEKRDEGKVGASTNSPKLHVGAGMLMCALNPIAALGPEPTHQVQKLFDTERFGDKWRALMPLRNCLKVDSGSE